MEKTIKSFKNGIALELIAGYAPILRWLSSDEPETCDWMVDHVQPDWTVLDVGAHIGVYTMILSILASKGKVYAFEPCETTRNMLLQNMAYNSGRFSFSNVRVFPLAVGNITGRNVDETLWLTDGTDQYGKTTGKFQFTTLDDFCLHQHNLKHIDFIKCDVDGWDYEVLLGAQEVLRKFRPYLIVEINYALKWRGHTIKEVGNLLDKVGYQHKPIDPTPGQWLCWPEEKDLGG